MKVYMNLDSGSVGTYHSWWYEDERGAQVNAVELGEVVEVEKDESGDWVEVE